MPNTSSWRPELSREGVNLSRSFAVNKLQTTCNLITHSLAHLLVPEKSQMLNNFVNLKSRRMPHNMRMTLVIKHHSSAFFPKLGSHGRHDSGKKAVHGTSFIHVCVKYCNTASKTKRVTTRAK